MFRFFKKSRLAEYRVVCRWIDTDDIFEVTGYSAGIASLQADPCIEIISIEKVGA